MTPEEAIQHRKAIQQRSYRKHRDRILEKKRLYYLANRDMLLARVKAYQETHPEKKRPWTWMEAVKLRQRRKRKREARA